MSKIALVTDSTANLSDELCASLNINVVPLVVIWDDKTYEDGIDIFAAEFYKKLGESKTSPTTSQATVGSFMTLYQKLFDQGYDAIFSVLISSKLSGTVDSATQAKAHFPDKEIVIVDSLCTSLPLAFQSIMLAKAIKNGANMQQLIDLTEKARNQQQVYFSVDSLEYLHRGGRINSATRFLGTALDLKPILELNEGKIEAVDRVRSSKKAYQRLLDLIDEKIKDEALQPLNFIGVIAAEAADAGDYLLSELKARYSPDTFLATNLSPVIGTHTGPGTVGIGIMGGFDEDIIK